MIEKLVRRFKDKRVVKYEVLWEDGSETIETRAQLMKDVAQLVKEFEEKEKED